MPVCKIPPRPHPPTTLPFHDDVVKFLAEWFAQPPATCGGRCFFFILEGLKLKKIQTWGVWFENPPRVRNRSLFASTAARVQGGGGVEQAKQSTGTLALAGRVPFLGVELDNDQVGAGSG